MTDVKDDAKFIYLNILKLEDDFHLSDIKYKYNLLAVIITEINKFYFIIKNIKNDNDIFILSFNIFAILNHLIENNESNNFIKNEKYISKLENCYSLFKDYVVNFFLELSENHKYKYLNTEVIFNYLIRMDFLIRHQYKFITIPVSRFYTERKLLMEIMEDERIKNNDKVYQGLFMFIMEE